MNFVPVPGFGFLPISLVVELESAYEEYLAVANISRNDVPYDVEDEIKCKAIVMPNWKDLYFSGEPVDQMCPPLWDNASCVPPIPAGQTAVFPCMRVFRGQDYSPSFNASRKCFSNSSWASTTDYRDCLCNSTKDCMMHQPSPENNSLEVTIVIYLVGYVVSFIALFCALIVFLTFREMRCLRHKIHIGLFCAFGLSALNWVVTKSLHEIAVHILPVFDIVYCTSWVVTFFFHMACFYWMFLEGFYLFLQVQFPLYLISFKYVHCLMLGCGKTFFRVISYCCGDTNLIGGPVLNIGIWICVRLINYEPADSDYIIKDCPFFEKMDLDFFLCELPIIIILCCNTFFLIWIMMIVVAKLRRNTAMDHDRKHWRAAKALIIVMPMLGFGYLITLVGPTQDQPTAHTIFEIVRSVLLSTQGLVISLPYCFLSAEVQGVIRAHWQRWWLVHTVGRGQLSARTSITASTTYSVHNKDNLQVHV